MFPSREPLKIKGTYVGAYDAVTCQICKRYFFTDKEYDLALTDARSLGLVGPLLPEKLPEKLLGVSFAELVLLEPNVSLNLVGKLNEKGEYHGEDPAYAPQPKVITVPHLVPIEITQTVSKHVG